MQLDIKAIEDLSSIIIGETLDPNDNTKRLTPEKTGRQLVDFFNHYGYRDVYNAPGVRGLPGNLSKKEYTKSKLRDLNNTKNMEKLLNDFIFSRNYIHSNFDIDHIAKYINTIIKYNGYELIKINDEYKVSGNYLIKEEPVQIEVTFEDIQKKIINEIRDAKYTIWIAVAWFTDDILFKELLLKKEEGVNIQVIILQDEINSSIRFEDYFETYRIRPYGIYDNIFHEKFCVIDLQTVIHGSYNWTKKAQFNKEDITTVRNRELAEQYANRFKELKSID